MADRDKRFKCRSCGSVGECKLNDCKNIDTIRLGKLPKINISKPKPKVIPPITDKSSFISNVASSAKRTRPEENQSGDWNVVHGNGFVSERKKKLRSNFKSNYDLDNPPNSSPLINSNDTLQLSNKFGLLSSFSNNMYNKDILKNGLFNNVHALPKASNGV